MDGYYSVLRKEISELLPERINSVMDIGCGTGVTAQWIKQTYGATAIGVELEKQVADAAKATLDFVYHTDIQTSDTPIKKHLAEVDVLLLLDVLEHLIDPWAVLKKIKPALTKEGLIIASIPNVQNFKVLLPLLFNSEWRYADSGILDRTHLRFFTRKSVEDMFIKCGYKVVSVKQTGPVEWKSIQSKAGYIAYFLNMLFFGKLKNFITHQFLIVATPV